MTNAPPLRAGRPVSRRLADEHAETCPLRALVTQATWKMAKRYAVQHEQLSVLVLSADGNVADLAVAKRMTAMSALPAVMRATGDDPGRISQAVLSTIDAALGISRIPVEIKFESGTDSKSHCLGVALRFDDSLVGYVVVGTYGDPPGPAKHDLVGLLAATLVGAYRSYSDAQQQNRLLEEQRAIVDHIGDGLLVLNRDGTIRYASASATRMLGLPAKSVGHALTDLLDFELAISPVFRSGVGYADREMIIDSPKRHLHIFDTAIPIKNSAGEVVSVVNTFREIERVRKVASRYAGSLARYTFDSLVGRSQSLLSCIDAARSAARGNANVLLEGESGVGKEVFAQAIHNASKRADMPFVALNCSALPRDLVESELFGYVSGSFTGAAREGRPGKFESANGGTIFLDEISELPMNAQAKLLRVIQEREVVRVGDTTGIPIDVRIICASNRELRSLVARNEFRADLFYRCNVLGIRIPALRERASDIPVLAEYFLSKYARLLGKPACRLSSLAIDEAIAYPWPGNIRELENTIERIVNLTQEEMINDFTRWLESGVEEPEIGAASPPAKPERGAIVAADVRPLRDQEGAAVRQALEACRYNVTRCASLLGISKPALYAKIKRYRIILERPL
jgi:transcriptional regulator with PAS, ATPase and Fis domain